MAGSLFMLRASGSKRPWASESATRRARAVLCECAEETCNGPSRSEKLEDYTKVRAHTKYFVMLPDTRSRGKELVARRDGYHITEKT